MTDPLQIRNHRPHSPNPAGYLDRFNSLPNYQLPHADGPVEVRKVYCIAISIHRGGTERTKYLEQLFDNQAAAITFAPLAWREIFGPVSLAPFQYTEQNVQNGHICAGVATADGTGCVRVFDIFVPDSLDFGGHTKQVANRV